MPNSLFEINRLNLVHKSLNLPKKENFSINKNFKTYDLHDKDSKLKSLEDDLTKAILPKIMDSDIFELLEERNAMIAGGVFTSLKQRTPINDIDVYFKNEEDFKNVLGTLYKNYLAIMVFDTDRSVTFYDHNERILIQLISYRYFDNLRDVFNDFDFTCCMKGYDFETNEIVTDENFDKSVLNRELIFSGKTKYPINTLKRVNKYTKRGFKIKDSEMMKIGLACSKLELNSYEDVKMHVGGMYGGEMKEIKAVEFELDAYIKQLPDLFDGTPRNLFPVRYVNEKYNIDVMDDQFEW